MVMEFSVRSSFMPDGRLTLFAKVFLDISVSIDGYTAGPEDTLEQPWAGAGTAS
jgi:hypothetical protein